MLESDRDVRSRFASGFLGRILNFSTKFPLICHCNILSSSSATLFTNLAYKQFVRLRSTAQCYVLTSSSSWKLDTGTDRTNIEPFFLSPSTNRTSVDLFCMESNKTIHSNRLNRVHLTAYIASPRYRWRGKHCWEL